MVTLGNDKNFALWDLSKKDLFHNPSFKKRIEIENRVNPLFSLTGWILLKITKLSSLTRVQIYIYMTLKSDFYEFVIFPRFLKNSN